MKKKLSLLLASATILFFANTQVFASEKMVSEENPTESIIKSESSVEKIRDDMIKEIEPFEGLILEEVSKSPSTKIDIMDSIPLYSLELDLPFGLISPLRNGETVSGYRIYGIVEGYYETLVTAESKEDALLFEYIKKKQPNRFTFIFPFTFIEEDQNDYNGVFLNIGPFGAEVLTRPIDISNIPEGSKNGIPEFMEHQKTRNENFISSVSDQSRSTISVQGLTHWRYGEFLPIYYGDIARYGANQNWMKPHLARNGCGPTAAAQMMAYLARHSGTSLNQTEFGRNLYTGGMVSRNFIPYMTDVYWKISPSVLLGTLTVDQLYQGAENYANTKGVRLWSYTITGRNLTNNVNFLKRGLSNNSPVALLTLGAPDALNFLRLHWVTVTNLFLKNNVYQVKSQLWCKFPGAYLLASSHSFFVGA